MAALKIKPQIEQIDVIGALDRVTAEAVFARLNSPLYDCAAMDGVAVVSANTRGASENNPATLIEGKDYIPLDTGDPIAQPYDAVIMAEDIVETENGVIIRAAASAWQHVRPVGEDVVSGEMILPRGHLIRPIDIGVLLSGGIMRINVLKSPSVAIIPTGTEIIEPGETVKPGDIIESNSRMFEALAIKGGGVPARFDIVPDDYERLKATIQDAAERFDMALVCAGTSAGREDFTAPIIRELGEIVVHGVAMKPGKPVILATVSGKPVFGIPGYPVSAYLAYESFIAPVLAELAGLLPNTTPMAEAVITKRLVSSLKYREYVRVKAGMVGGRLVASPLARGAGAAMSLVRADGFCVIDQDIEGLEAGEKVNIILSRGLDNLERTVVSIGSHDLCLDILADLLPNMFPGVNLSSTHVGSLAGLMALKNKEAHIAPVHLLDESTGAYNEPAIKNLFKGQNTALIKGLGRVQGIMTQKGNPLGIKRIEDLPKGSFVNRKRGAGTRVLLDFKLKALDVNPADIEGYAREAATHMAVAAAVQSGSADAGLGILSAARAMGLDFFPVGDEEYDFAVLAEYLELPHVRAFIEALKTQEFLRKMEELGGYSAKRCGEVVPLEC
jgi:putative molybdopterin biosynthesis protein